MISSRAQFALLASLTPTFACSLLLSVSDYDAVPASDASVDTTADGGDAPLPVDANLAPCTELPEGVVGDILATKNTKTDNILYTLNPGEIDNAASIGFDQKLGVVFRAYKVNMATVKTVPLYRSRAKSLYYYWTLDENDHKAHIANGAADEGIGMWVAKTEGPCGSPVYRLQNGEKTRLIATEPERQDLVDAGWTGGNVGPYFRAFLKR